VSHLCSVPSFIAEVAEKATRDIVAVATSGSKSFQNVVIRGTVSRRVLLDAVYSDGVFAIQFLDESSFPFVEGGH